MQRYLYRGGDPYAVAWDIGLTTHEKVGASDDIDGIKGRALYSLFLLMIAPVVLFALAFFWEKYCNKQYKEHAKRRAAAANLVEPTQEAHLTKLMENYSMILSKSDIFNENQHSNRGEGGCAVGESTDASVLCKNDDIEMQIPEKGRNNDKIIEPKCIECDDNSQCHNYSFHIPKAGQRVGEEGGECETMNLPRRIESDGCAVCMNPLDIGQKVVWSSNPECSHVFHQQCLLDWFGTVGAKRWKTRVARNLEMDPMSLKEEICKFPKLCPICRRKYFLEAASEEAITDNESDSDITNNTDGSYNDGSNNEANDIEQATRS